MTLRLTTGDRVPVDGEITQATRLDEAMLTGEPIPNKITGRCGSCRYGSAGRQRAVPRQCRR